MKKFSRTWSLIVLIIIWIGLIAASDNKPVGVNVLLNTEVTDQILLDLGTHGKLREIFYTINAVTMQAKVSDLDLIRSLPYVAAVNPDADRSGSPINAVSVDNFGDGFSTWNLDAINVTDWGMSNRQPVYDGTGVYIAVLDTGLINNWRSYFPEERIAVEYARSFGGGGNNNGNVSEQPNKWETDVNSHGTHVTSTIIGYNLPGLPINGVAPLAKIIPVKVLGQAGWGWSSVVAQGILYVAELKAGPLADNPVVINLSLGGSVLDALEQAAIDYAIKQGVIIVAAAGNAGQAGMSYPGAYSPVISVGAFGWVGEWQSGSAWWLFDDINDPTDPQDFYITDFSGRQKAGQDLDVTAPGSWVLGPYQLNSSNHTSFFFLSGTSMATPHVAGIVALMAQKDPSLDALDAEEFLENGATSLNAGCQNVANPSGEIGTVCWDLDAVGSGLVTADGALSVMTVNSPEEQLAPDPPSNEEANTPPNDLDTPVGDPITPYSIPDLSYDDPLILSNDPEGPNKYSKLPQPDEDSWDDFLELSSPPVLEKADDSVENTLESDAPGSPFRILLPILQSSTN